jgi:hypothetical protein
LPKGTPRDQFLANRHVPQCGRKPAVYGIDEVGVAAGRSSALPCGVVAQGVVDGQRAGQERIAAVWDANHGELAWNRGRGDRRTVEPEPPRVVGDPAVGHDLCRGEGSGVGVAGLADWLLVDGAGIA